MFREKACLRCIARNVLPVAMKIQHYTLWLVARLELHDINIRFPVVWNINFPERLTESICLRKRYFFWVIKDPVLQVIDPQSYNSVYQQRQFEPAKNQFFVHAERGKDRN